MGGRNISSVDMRITLAWGLAALLSLLCASCTSRDISDQYKLKKGSVITLNEPYYFLDYPGTDSLELVRGYEPYSSEPPPKTFLPIGTKVEYLKTREYDALMMPMPDRTAYGKVLGHKKMNKVSIDSLIENQSVNY